MRQLLDEEGEAVGAWRVFRRGDDVLPGLAMSRSLGDTYAQSAGVSAEPVLASYQLTERDVFLVSMGGQAAGGVVGAWAFGGV